jgi:hypothetical protein
VIILDFLEPNSRSFLVKSKKVDMLVTGILALLSVLEYADYSVSWLSAQLTLGHGIVKVIGMDIFLQKYPSCGSNCLDVLIGR